MYDLPSALISLRPGSAWKLDGDDYSGLNWLDPNSTPPSRDECEAEMARLKQEYDNKAYARNRKAAYPNIADQLDRLYHEGYDGWHAMITEIKQRYPKPE
jgi:hypothetical protein